MKDLPSPLRRALIRLSYLAPVLCGIALLIYACVPHIFFLYNGEPFETMNLFTLMSNTWGECNALLESTEDVSVNAVYFSYIMNFFVILSWICIVLFALFALATAITSTYAFSQPPTAKQTNRTKRWLQFFCPNRPLYVISCLLPLIPAAVPLILEKCYTSLLYYDIKVYFIGVADLILAAIAAVLCVGSFLALLPAQSREHMDMYRLYKAKKEN